MSRLIFVASLLIISLGLLWPRLYGSFNNSTSLATVTSSSGTVEWISRKNLRGEKPKKDLPLQINESLSTGVDGEIVLHFKRGAEIRLLENTFITLTKKANSTLVALRRGQINVIREGEANSVLITQQGEDIALSDYLGSLPTETLAIEAAPPVAAKMVEPALQTPMEVQAAEPPSGPPAATLIAAPHSAAPDAQPALSASPLTPNSPQRTKDLQAQIRSMINDRLTRQKNRLFHCYTSLIQNRKNAQGKLNLHFFVNSLGKVEDPIVVKTELPDPKFETCLLQTIKRTDFQPFQGPKVSTFLPLRFDKNLSQTVE